MRQPPEEIKIFLLNLAKILGVRVEKILDLYLYVSPDTVKIVEVVERGSEIAGVRLAVKSKKSDVWYYTSVGYYGAKCTCRGSSVGGRICRHMVIGVITWSVISLLKTGTAIDPSALHWLKYLKETEK